MFEVLDLADRRVVSRHRDFGISESCLVAGSSAPRSKMASRWPHLVDEAEIRELKRWNRLLEQGNEVLRRAAISLGKVREPKVIYPLIRDLAADGIPVG